MSDYLNFKEHIARPEFNYPDPEKKQQIISDFNKGITRRPMASSETNKSVMKNPLVSMT